MDQTNVEMLIENEGKLVVLHKSGCGAPIAEGLNSTDEAQRQITSYVNRRPYVRPADYAVFRVNEGRLENV